MVLEYDNRNILSGKQLELSALKLDIFGVSNQYMDKKLKRKSRKPYTAFYCCFLVFALITI
jgi:hypothetical protein